MLIASVMVTAVLGVSVTATQGSAKSMHRQMFDQGISQVSGQIKNYVTGCGCDKGGACTVAACTPPNGLLGPNTNNGGVNTWYFNNAPGPSGAIVDSMGNVWALACGTHILTNVLTAGTPNLEAVPFSGHISYTVTWPGGCPGAPGTETPKIDFSASWTEP